MEIFKIPIWGFHVGYFVNIFTTFSKKSQAPVKNCTAFFEKFRTPARGQGDRPPRRRPRRHAANGRATGGLGQPRLSGLGAADFERRNRAAGTDDITTIPRRERPEITLFETRVTRGLKSRSHTRHGVIGRGRIIDEAEQIVDAVSHRAEHSREEPRAMRGQPHVTGTRVINGGVAGAVLLEVAGTARARSKPRS